MEGIRVRRVHLAAFIAMLTMLSVTFSTQAKTNIGFVSQFTDQQDDRGEVWRGLIQEFNKSQNAIEVEILSWGSSSPGPQSEKMLAWVAGGQAPDVFEFHGTNHGPWAVQGIIADLTPFLDRPNARTTISMSSWTSSAATSSVG
jgi:ABC-type glycerol-3-phosphate transport system substrate-binding protein